MFKKNFTPLILIVLNILYNYIFTLPTKFEEAIIVYVGRPNICFQLIVKNARSIIILFNNNSISFPI